MFGIGGLTGLPWAWAASDVALHDTYYVVAHFHYLVAPGTVFALFAGIYHWYPRITAGCSTSAWPSALLGHVRVDERDLPPHVRHGPDGVNRRLYDAGMQYALAQPTLAWQPHMTYAAVALGFFQLPFVWNLVASALRKERDRDNPWDSPTLEWAGSRESETGVGNQSPGPEPFESARYRDLSDPPGHLAVPGIRVDVLRRALLGLRHAAPWRRGMAAGDEGLSVARDAAARGASAAVGLHAWASSAPTPWRWRLWPSRW